MSGDGNGPVSVDTRDGFVGRCELRPLRDILGMSIGVVSSHDEILRLPHAKPHVFGKHFKPFDSRVGLTRWRGPVGDPFGNDAVVQRVCLESQATFVRQGSGRLGEDQTAAWIRQFDPAASRLFRDRVKIRRRVVASQRESESALAGQGSVTRARVAACLREGGQDVILERPVVRSFEVGHRDFRRRTLTAGFDCHSGGSVRLWNDDAVFHDDNRLVGRRPLRVSRLADQTTVDNSLSQESLPRFGTGQLDFGRDHHKWLPGGGDGERKSNDHGKAATEQ